MGHRIIILPFEEAVSTAVKQNIEYDKSIGIYNEGNEDIYREEAIFLLTVLGENFLPEDPSIPHIKVKK
ncbi:MAG: hypothetical protein M0R77_00275 [Gammaproteobacteria bacterium]|nr:hypothetical protein [Gammaproteobacteria bacterium]